MSYYKGPDYIGNPFDHPALVAERERLYRPTASLGVCSRRVGR